PAAGFPGGGAARARLPRVRAALAAARARSGVDRAALPPRRRGAGRRAAPPRGARPAQPASRLAGRALDLHRARLTPQETLSGRAVPRRAGLPGRLPRAQLDRGGGGLAGGFLV